MIYINQKLNPSISNNYCVFSDIVKLNISQKDFVFGTFKDITYCKNNNVGLYSCWDLSVDYFLPFITDLYINFKNSYYKQVCQLTNDDINRFCRSNSGKKVWSGQIIKSDVDISTIKQYCQSDDLLFLSPIKQIFNECRFWIKDQKIITHSFYNNPFNNNQNININIDDYIKFIEQLIDFWEPDSLYTVDIGLSDNQIKVIEYNCYSTSGFYNSDVNKIINSIKDF